MIWQKWRLCVFHSPFKHLSKRVCKIPILPSNFDRQRLSLYPRHHYCSLRIQFVFNVECFLVDVEHKSQEILRDIVYTCMILKVLERCVSWLHDISNQPATMLKSCGIGYNTWFRMNLASCNVTVFSCNLVPQCSRANFSFRIREGIFYKTEKFET